MKNRASTRAWHASTHSALAMWVFPQPTSPMSTRSSRPSRKERPSRSSLPKPSGHETADQSYPSKVFGAGSAQRLSSAALFDASRLERSASR